MGEMEIIRHPQIEGISVFFNTVEYRTPHLHSEIELVWILEGRLEVSCGQSQFQAEPEDLLLLNSEVLHEFRKGKENCTFLCLQISPRCFSDCCPAVEHMLFQDIFPAKRLSSEELTALKREFAALARTYMEQPPFYELFCQAQAGLMLYRLLEKLPTRRMTASESADLQKYSARLRRFLDFVDENYQNKILLSDFARQEKRSVGYLSHFLKDMLNQTFQEYVNSVRLQAACKLIHQGRRRMLDVCMESGFSDYRYFVSAFRKQFGQTPAEYSKSVHLPASDSPAIRRSQHSLEKFYSQQESLRLLDRLEQTL